MGTSSSPSWMNLGRMRLAGVICVSANASRMAGFFRFLLGLDGSTCGCGVGVPGGGAGRVYLFLAWMGGSATATMRRPIVAMSLLAHASCFHTSSLSPHVGPMDVGLFPLRLRSRLFSLLSPFFLEDLRRRLILRIHPQDRTPKPPGRCSRGGSQDHLVGDGVDGGEMDDDVGRHERTGRIVDATVAMRRKHEAPGCGRDRRGEEAEGKEGGCPCTWRTRPGRRGVRRTGSMIHKVAWTIHVQQRIKMEVWIRIARVRDTCLRGPACHSTEAWQDRFIPKPRRWAVPWLEAARGTKHPVRRVPWFGASSCRRAALGRFP